MSDASEVRCYHCTLPVPPGTDYRVEIDGVAEPMCCAGCRAVAQAIVDAGLTDYYRYRTEPSQNPEQLVPQALRELDLYDRPELQRSFVLQAGADLREASLILEGITCAACVWLSERHVKGLPGVLDFSVNYSTHRARVRWDDSRIKLSDILRAIAAIGYLAHPFDPGRQEQVQKRERSLALRRLAVAGLGMMQVMMLAVALYVGPQQGMEPHIVQFIRWVSLLITVPVVFYSGASFFVNAWRDLSHRRLGMDVPVALAVGSTFAASAWATLTGGGEVFFESVTMFVFFLLTGRFLEMNARQRAGQAVEALGKLLPAVATRLRPDGSEETVAVTDLAPGDRVRVSPGAPVPADGVVAEGRSSLDESLMSGESLPRERGVGDPLVGGTVNVESPLVMRVEQVGPDTVLSGIQRLLERAQAEKPAVAKLTERGTGWFVLLILLLALGAGLLWWSVDPGKAFWVAVAVLVVSCPCALALATPVAITASTGFLTRIGVLVTRGHALETLARATHVVFDKTGTLTEGRPGLREVWVTGRLPEARCVAIAAGLEAGSEHPMGKAIRALTPTPPHAEAQRSYPGQGIEACLDGELYRIGTPEFVAELDAEAGTAAALRRQAEAVAGRWPDAALIFLGARDGLLAVFALGDELRPGAVPAVAALRAMGLEVLLLSGDAPGPVARTAARVGIERYEAGLLPAQKLEAIERLQREGAVVAMVGDGINDAPVLSRAQVSLAMASGTELAQASADMILHSDKLEHLAVAVTRARSTLRIIAQNLVWALGYNLLALPVAAAGWLSPWLAALGMSLSSLLVVLNSLRLTLGNAPGPRGSDTARHGFGTAQAAR